MAEPPVIPIDPASEQSDPWEYLTYEQAAPAWRLEDLRARSEGDEGLAQAWVE